MKIAALVSTIFALGVFHADAFGVGHRTQRTATGSVSVSVSKSDNDVGFTTGRSMESSELKMSSDVSGEKVIIGKDFRLSAIFLIGGILLDNIPYLQVTLGPIVTLLGVLFLVQTFRLNFVCDETSFSLEGTSSDGTVGENIVVGGENRWTYDSFVNYDFFPAGWIDQPQGPILVYFKETQTPSGKRKSFRIASIFLLGLFLSQKMHCIPI